MKRLLIRMSTLATVVVLGLIAIAQAQRGAEDRPPEVSASAAAAEVPGPGVARGQSEEEPGLFPGGPGINPLRGSEKRPTVSHDFAASGESAGRYARRTEAPIGPAGSGDAAGARSHDPFAVLVAGQTDDAGEQPGIGEAMPANVPPGASGTEESPPGSTRYPQLLSPEGPDYATGSPTPPAPAESNPGDSLRGNPYGGVTRPTGNVREPGKLPLDPNVPVSSLPYSPLRAADSAALPGLGSAADEIGTRIEGAGTPGHTLLEGPQSPQLTIQKFAPAEIQVGKEAMFRVTVINTGRIAAEGVEIRDQVPKGTRLLGTNPSSSLGEGGELVWSLGTIEPGDEVSVEVRLMPEAEGEIGSVATVAFSAAASVRTIATRPELVIQTSAPSQALIGEEVALVITVSNPGSGVATNVVLEEHVPAGLSHPAGEELEYEVGDLKPNESRELELTLTAEDAGVLTNLLRARADANLRIEDQREIEVVAPRLDVALEGPKRRFLERQATYTLSVSNPGTAPARNVELMAELPAGFEFVSANNAGHYEPTGRTIRWNLEELPIEEIGTVRLTAVPTEEGEQVLRFSCTAEPGQAVAGEQPILVEGIADISFRVVDADDPIELGGETIYEIQVVNRGSKAASNVIIQAMLPPGMQAVDAEGPERYQIDGSRVIFAPLSRLAPKADTTYRVRVQGLQPGDQRLSVLLQTDDMSAPVTKEESTRVYSDE